MAAHAALAENAPLITRDERSVLENAVYTTCYYKAKTDAEFTVRTQQLKRDTAETYCSCFAKRMAVAVNDDSVRHATQHKAMDANLQIQLKDASAQCKQASFATTP